MVVELRFPIAKIWKQPKYSPTNGQIEKMWYIHTTETYLALKKKELKGIKDLDITWQKKKKKELSHLQQGYRRYNG